MAQKSLFRLSSLPQPLDELQITGLQRGTSFRTVQALFTPVAMSDSWTVHYLLLSPELPAPSENEMINYTDTGALTDGRAARGIFFLSLAKAGAELQRKFSGREGLMPLPKETGVIDGFPYVLYMMGVTASGYKTGVVRSPVTATGMPFERGSGTPEDPFILRQLTSAEIAVYPDLTANHPANRAGINETARQLDNIEGMRVLHELHPLYGMADSLNLHYQIQNEFDLVGYVEAYEGGGWRPIGNDDVIFTGSLTGGAIKNLSLTPLDRAESRRVYTGFIGLAAEAKFTNLTINGASVTIPPCPPDNIQRTGVLCAYARDCTFSGISIKDAVLNACPQQTPTGDLHCTGGLIGEGEVSSFFAVSNIQLSGITLAAGSCAGGMIGKLKIASAGSASIDGFSITAQVAVKTSCVGGVVGKILGEANALLAVRDGSVQKGSSITGRDHCGGLLGVGSYTAISNCSFSGVVSGKEAVGGLLGSGAGLSIRNSVCTGSVSGGPDCSEKIGGLAGVLYYRDISPSLSPEANIVELSSMRGEINSVSGNYVGGLVGFSAGVTFKQCFSIADLTKQTGNHIGALIGGTAVYAGVKRGIIQNCYTTGSVRGTGHSYGGITGRNVSDILMCYSTGRVKGRRHIGGITGEQIGSQTILHCLDLYGHIGTPMINTLGWDTVNIWDISSLKALGRLTLLHNPE